MKVANEFSVFTSFAGHNLLELAKTDLEAAKVRYLELVELPATFTKQLNQIVAGSELEK